MSIHFSGDAVGIRADRNSTTALLTVGRTVRDNLGNTYMYVGASGVVKGAPVKHVGGDFSACVIGTAAEDVLGVATAEFPTTGYTYGFIGVRGTHSTKVPSGTSAGAIVVGGNGSTAAASAPSGQSTATHPSKHGVTKATAQDDGSVIDVYWF